MTEDTNETGPATATEKPAETPDNGRNYLALPSTVQGLLDRRKTPKKATLHDLVETLYLKVYEDDHFRQLREPIYREQSIEGALSDDDTLAALMIRDAAKHEGVIQVAREKLSVIRKSMFVVERRYNATRTQRREFAER